MALIGEFLPAFDERGKANLSYQSIGFYCLDPSCPYHHPYHHPYPYPCPLETELFIFFSLVAPQFFQHLALQMMQRMIPLKYLLIIQQLEFGLLMEPLREAEVEVGVWPGYWALYYCYSVLAQFGLQILECWHHLASLQLAQVYLVQKELQYSDQMGKSQQNPSPDSDHQY